ncbi:PIG-L deacetylase family protein [Amycolatopsis roodepoortensis]|uniref:LmbE family N-acetylglucosaminyl deacetylase n=1 Tax=Amycolatopsis roodepoortensis TaxID=700274 RepID=A0ABR9L9T3_9PSEU|nr:PIG-L family deacetylase [Amycolatopsis roodepoortensis]MBE1577142.1 LmbE family N-acetylglucosaminyl deacetylase [Amycolatopsis roodepoortensis]
MTTIVAFHAHPDDEALLTGGTLARAAADGHRVVLVVATIGMRGVDASRRAELEASAEVLGVARVVHLGYADSGHGAVLYPDPPGLVRFVRASTDEAAARLMAILREEGASVLLSYDRNGGYGHRDHVKVHEVGKRAAELAGDVRLLEATIPRDAVARLIRIVRLARIPFRYDVDALLRAYSAKSEITHTFDVRRFARQKQAAIAAHSSQVKGDGRLAPLMRVITRLPAPLFGLVFAREWYVDATSRGSRS